MTARRALVPQGTRYRSRRYTAGLRVFIPPARPPSLLATLNRQTPWLQLQTPRFISGRLTVEPLCQ
jgi:hypothetical protein